MDTPASLSFAGVKRASGSPQASSSTEKRPKLVLPESELGAFNAKMKGISRRQRWKTRMEDAEGAEDDSEWKELLSDVLVGLTGELALTALKGSVIPPTASSQADEIVKDFKSDDFNEWKDAVQEGVTGGNWEDLVAHLTLRIDQPEAFDGPDKSPPYHWLVEQEDAVVMSWEREFGGDAAEALWSYIKNHYNTTDGRIYAHYAAIVQSSGMGKSRTVDELAKKHFVIPINLRGPHSQGFPPPDHAVRDFLVNGESQNEAYKRSCAFMKGLFEITTRTLIDNGLADEDLEAIASRFRTLMTHGQTFRVANEFRQAFFLRVIEVAKAELLKLNKEDGANESAGPVYNSPKKSKRFTAAKACSDLADLLLGRDRVREGSPTPTPRRSARQLEKANQKPPDAPVIIVAWDEAHLMTKLKLAPGADNRGWSYFTELRHTLRGLSNDPCFCLFMSTTGKLVQFTPAPEDDISRRILYGDLILIQPFTDLGFDTLTKKISLEKMPDLEYLASDGYMAHLGRPMFGSLYDAADESVRKTVVVFAVAKLLNSSHVTNKPLTDAQCLACISQRILIEFNSTTYISQARERTQVEGHMRVCLKVDAGFESMVTVSASEPLLSEAAYSVMTRENFDTLGAMKTILEGFAINKGDRGEFIVLLMLTMARDATVGPADADGRPVNGSRIFSLSKFVGENLFNNPPLQRQLREDFPEGKAHFNHCIKVHEFKLVKAQRLLLLAARGASVLCGNSQDGVDGINPFLCKGLELSLLNLGLILWQGKNDSHYSHLVQQHLFDRMDPFRLGILEDGDPAIPLIKIVFALAARTPLLSVKRCAPTKEYNAPVYEIWCAGLSPELLSPVTERQAHIWPALLQLSYGWEQIYKGGNPGLRRSMNPGAAADPAHWSQWVEPGQDLD